MRMDNRLDSSGTAARHSREAAAVPGWVRAALHHAVAGSAPVALLEPGLTIGGHAKEHRLAFRADRTGARAHELTLRLARAGALARDPARHDELLAGRHRLLEG